MNAPRRMGTCLLLLTLSGCRDAVPPPALGSAEAPIITVEGSTVRYNGQALDWNDTEHWRRVLGPDSRQQQGIFTWDALGIMLHDTERERPGPEAVEFLLGRKRPSPYPSKEPSEWPRKVFPGQLILDGAVITVDSSVDQINRAKKGIAFKRHGYLAGVQGYDVEGFDLQLRYAHDGSLTSFRLEKPPLPETPAEPPPEEASP